ncbi:hypothetical protein ABG067_003277 [Albugo candida]
MESVDSALRFLQKQFSGFENEAIQWSIERRCLEDKVKELENEKVEQEDRFKDALLRIKMLEFALRQERGRYLVSPAPVTSVSNVYARRTASTSNSNGPSNSGNGHFRKTPSGAEIFRRVSSGTERAQETVQYTTHSDPPSSESKMESQVYRLDGNLNAKNKLLETEISREISRPKRNSRVNISGNSVTTDESSANKPFSIPQAAKSNQCTHKLKVKLLGHLDAVRSLCFHPTEPIVVSGSEDCTVRLWNLAGMSNGPPAQRSAELDSFITLRKHSDCVLAVSMISSENYPGAQPERLGAFATAGRDGSISLVEIPQLDTEKVEPYTYEEYQELKVYTEKKAHDDAIWHLHAHPLSNILFSAGADGVVRTWGINKEIALKSELRCTSNYDSQATGRNAVGALVPTSVHTILTDTKTCAVGYTSGAIGQFDFHGEQLIQLVMAPNIDRFEAREAQVNKVVSHPTMPLILAGHQDGRIRIYDLRAGECIASVNAHLDAVSSVSIDAAGLAFTSIGHDGSFRVWSITDRLCVFEHMAHKSKYSEAAHDIAYHPSRNFIATAGADGVIKVFQ